MTQDTELHRGFPGFIGAGSVYSISASEQTLHRSRLLWSNQILVWNDFYLWRYHRIGRLSIVHSQSGCAAGIHQFCRGMFFVRV